MTARVMRVALKREKLVNRSDRGRVAARDPYFPAARTIDRLVPDRVATRLHDRRPRHDLRVDRERFGEVARAERGLNVPHVRANRRDRGRVRGIVAIEDDTPAIRQILKDVRRRVLVDTHDARAARLHRREILVRTLATRENDRYDEAADSER